MLKSFCLDDYEQVNGGDGWCWIVDNTKSGELMRYVHFSFYLLLCIYLVIMSALVFCAVRETAVVLQYHIYLCIYYVICSFANCMIQIIYFYREVLRVLFQAILALLALKQLCFIGLYFFLLGKL